MTNKKFLIFGIVAIIITISFFLLDLHISDRAETKSGSKTLNPDSIPRSSTYQIDSFEISTTIINGSINSITKLDDSNSILVELSPFNDGNLIIKIPKTMLKAIDNDYSKFFFLILSDGEEIPYELIDTETTKINFQNHTKKIEIIGASRLN